MDRLLSAKSCFDYRLLCHYGMVPQYLVIMIFNRPRPVNFHNAACAVVAGRPRSTNTSRIGASDPFLYGFCLRAQSCRRGTTKGGQDFTLRPCPLAEASHTLGAHGSQGSVAAQL